VGTWDVRVGFSDDADVASVCIAVLHSEAFCLCVLLGLACLIWLCTVSISFWNKK
jgi:hypothetical protein